MHSAPLASPDAVGSHYRHVYLSPHFDDVALSVGGTILRQRRQGEPVLVVTVFTARPGEAVSDFARYQHDRWGGQADPWREREDEERAAMAALGVDYLWLGYHDAIYRGDQYHSDEELFGPIKPGDASLREALARDLRRVLARCTRAALYAPLGVGRHVDHQLCGAAAQVVRGEGVPTAYYEDCPYAMLPGEVERRLGELSSRLRPHLVELGDLVDEKVGAVGLYRSQVPWIFRDYGEWRTALRRYAAGLSGRPAGFAERLWVDEDWRSF